MQQQEIRANEAGEHKKARVKGQKKKKKESQSEALHGGLFSHG